MGEARIGASPYDHVPCGGFVERVCRNVVYYIDSMIGCYNYGTGNHEGRNPTMKYKGIELEGLDKKVKLSHSRVMETDEGTDWIEKLLTCDKAALTPTQFHEVSALSSVINMDYQICNGGIGQYVGNGYHEYRALYSDDDVEHYGAVEQVYMLRALADFGDNVFPYADSCNREVRQWANLFDHIDFDSVDYYDEVIGEYVSPEAVEECEQSYYGGVSDHVGLLCEAYAQYLCKSYGID